MTYAAIRLTMIARLYTMYLYISYLKQNRCPSDSIDENNKVKEKR